MKLSMSLSGLRSLGAFSMASPGDGARKHDGGVQGRLEDVAFQLRIPQRKPWQAMLDNVAAASAVVAQRDKARASQGFSCVS